MTFMRCLAMCTVLLLSACDGDGKKGSNAPPPTGQQQPPPGQGNETPPIASKSWATLPSGSYPVYCLRLKSKEGQWYARARVLGVDPELVPNPQQRSASVTWPTRKDVVLKHGSDTMREQARQVALKEAQSEGRTAADLQPLSGTVCEERGLIADGDVLNVDKVAAGLQLRFTHAGQTRTFPLSPPPDLQAGQQPMWFQTPQAQGEVQYFLYFEDAVSDDPAFKLQRYRIEAFAPDASEACRGDIPVLNTDTLRPVTTEAPCEPAFMQENGVGAGNEPR